MTSGTKPRFRGTSHQIAAVVSPVCGAILLLWAPPGRSRTGAVVFAAALTAMFTASAAYHRPDWKRMRVRWFMSRVDQSMIFVLIAGTFTPFALEIDTPMSRALLPAVWGLAGLFIVGQMFPLRRKPPKWVATIPFLALGWLGAFLIPEVFQRLSRAASVLIAVGGLLYTVGAVVYARRSPDPKPSAFGYHEVFHLFVIAAAACHFAAVAMTIT